MFLPFAYLTSSWAMLTKPKFIESKIIGTYILYAVTGDRLYATK